MTISFSCEHNREIVTYYFRDEWPKGVPMCPECLAEWVVKHSRAIEHFSNPPTLGIRVNDGSRAKSTLR